MKKLILALLGLAVVLVGRGPAQGAVERIAYDSCYWDYWYSGALVCSVIVVQPGSGSLTVASGTEPAWSPDGSKIAFVGNLDGGIFVLNLVDWSLVQITTDGASPAWSPDGLKIAFSSTRTGPFELYVMNADGSAVTQVTDNVRFAGQPAWSPDGGRIAFDCQVDIYNWDICAVNANGTEFVRLTNDPAGDSSAAWSPDGATIAFATRRYQTQPEIAMMNPDGSGVRRVSPGIAGFGPVWSPDSTRIAFEIPFEGACTDYCGDGSIYVMNIDGTDVTAFATGNRPAWTLSRTPVALISSPGCNGRTCSFVSASLAGEGAIASHAWDFGDGANGAGPTVSYTYAAPGTYTVTLTVTDTSGATATQSQSVTAGNTPPVASFASGCSGLTCSFDGSGSSDSDGTITNYTWNFGDGTTGSSAALSHTYAAAGTYTVMLTVTDNGGSTGALSQSVTIVNAPPVASFTSACSGVTCSFNGSASSDPDGTITSYSWNFGDGTTGAGVTVSHTYAAASTYTVTLTTTDNGGATGAQSKSVAVTQSLMHVGDLDGSITNQGSMWTTMVTITVHDSNHRPVASATVSGSWSNGGTASCTTNSIGQCAVSKSTIPKSMRSVTFTVVNVTHATLTYNAPDNHDPDGDSNGTVITLSRP
jgi:Tol biopolymer transport system component/PKD repeat protein